MPRAALILIAFIGLIRLPFLNQPFQLDDYYYLKAAKHALEEPLHPHHAKYVFLGIEFDMRGHPHPPGNAWILAILLKIVGSANEIPLHLAWIVFTAGAVWATHSIARRLCPERALDVTLLACSVPVFNTAGNSLFTDLPFICFWTAAIAFGLQAGERRSRAWLTALSLGAAAAISYQAAVAIPILAFMWWRRGWLGRCWWALAAPLLVAGGYQLFENVFGGAMPAQVLAGHFKQFGLQRLEMKLKNAAALTAHLAWMTSPVLLLAIAGKLRRRLWPIPVLALGAGLLMDSSPLFWLAFTGGALILTWIATAGDIELRLWFGIYFLAALAIFFAGAARYLLPAMLPLALLAGRTFSGRPWVLRASTAVNIALGLSLSWVNYEVGTAYRDVAAQWLPKDSRVWVNAEWGLREYTERGGARPLLRGTEIRAGDWLISSALADQVGYSMGGAEPKTMGQLIVRPTLPLRLMGLGARSAFETVGYGLRPFDVTDAPVDVVTLTRFGERTVERSGFCVADPGVDDQILSGIFPRENPQWRWAEKKSEFLLNAPRGTYRLRADGSVPDAAPGRFVELSMNGKSVASVRLQRPGEFVIESKDVTTEGGSARIELSVDSDFSPGGGDRRRLAMIVKCVEFVPSPPQPAQSTPLKR